jgi:hypothetical protein
VRFWVSLLIALAVFVSGGAFSTTAIAQSDEIIYVVQSGDIPEAPSLSGTGRPWLPFMEANPQIQNASLIFPGQRLTIPEGAHHTGYRHPGHAGHPDRAGRSGPIRNHPHSEFPGQRDV